MAYPVFANGDVLNASDMNAVGSWFVKSQTIGSGVSSVTVSDAFNTNFNAYKIIITGGVASGTVDLRLTLGASATTYAYGIIYNTTATAAPAGLSSASTTSFPYAGSGTTNFLNLDCELINPFAAQYTIMNGFYNNGTSLGTINGVHATATSYTAFTLTPSAGTLTGGTINVYGYRK
jgi:hypothetical protein